MKKKFEFPEIETILFQEEPIMDSTTGNNSIDIGSGQAGASGSFGVNSGVGTDGWF